MRKCAWCFATEEPGEYHKINKIIIKVRPSTYTAAGGTGPLACVCAFVGKTSAHQRGWGRLLGSRGQYFFCSLGLPQQHGSQVTDGGRTTNWTANEVHVWRFTRFCPMFSSRPSLTAWVGQILNRVETNLKPIHKIYCECHWVMDLKNGGWLSMKLS